ncbi:hypothetical protein T4B_8147 [Trichinella pseudospiralis]|uniref:Uncharacterized protein n=1 Tax=Trichinella pseudospiralis TaxID=6337 RepID=A0A0V1EXL5_TRIPS|nr:hypothetical protein T4A_12126 [Trichinella pseudospiralis]KRZ32089.1 hypothetical protein T4B_8147 [Trichinella pseudospiralis]KRZ46160.1 hypothetical protein T4C_8298 [Trichinella pseudospiralis]
MQFATVSTYVNTYLVRPIHLQLMPSWKTSTDLPYDWSHTKCEKEALGSNTCGGLKGRRQQIVEINDPIHRQKLPGSDTSGSGRTTICVTFRLDFGC